MKKILKFLTLFFALATTSSLMSYAFTFKNDTPNTFTLVLNTLTCNPQRHTFKPGNEFTFQTGGCCLSEVVIESNEGTFLAKSGGTSIPTSGGNILCWVDVKFIISFDGVKYKIALKE